MERWREENREHPLAYHLMWCPRRRKALLSSALARDCVRLIGGVWVQCRWAVNGLAAQPDPLRLSVRACPSTPAAQIARRRNGRSSRAPRRARPQLLSPPSLWTRSFFCWTLANVSQQKVDRCIAAQGRP